MGKSYRLVCLIFLMLATTAYGLNTNIYNGGELRFWDAGDSNYVGFKAPALTANMMWTLPIADGNSGDAIKTDGAGNWYFGAVGGAETDPCWTASPSYGITDANITHWQTAYGWGNHATQNYLDFDTYPNTDTNSLNDLTASTSWGGDLSGTGASPSVTNDSHDHTASTVSGLGVADFTSANVSQWTNDANYFDIDTYTLDNVPEGTNYKRVSAANYTDLTDSGDSTLHYHAADRARTNHTGTQTASTISDFSTAADARIAAISWSGDLSGTGTSPAVVDDSHNHVYSNIDETTSANWATTVSDESGTGVWIFVDNSTLGKNDVIKWNGSTWRDANTTDTFTFSIATFTWNDTGSTTVEMGLVNTQWLAAGAIHFDASYNNGPPDVTPHVDKTSLGWSADLNMTGTGYIGPTSSIYDVNYPASITVTPTRSFVLHAIQAPDSQVTNTKTVTFKNKKYFGFDNGNDILSSAETIALGGVTPNWGWVGTSKDDLDTSSVDITSTGSQYIHFVYPSRLDPTTIKFYLGGFDTAFVNLGTFTFTNATGYQESYRDYVSPQPYENATVGFVVTATP